MDGSKPDESERLLYPVLHRVQKLWIGPGKARKLLGIQLVTLALALE